MQNVYYTNSSFSPPALFAILFYQTSLRLGMSNIYYPLLPLVWRRRFDISSIYLSLYLFHAGQMLGQVMAKWLFVSCNRIYCKDSVAYYFTCLPDKSLFKRKKMVKQYNAILSSWHWLLSYIMAREYVVPFPCIYIRYM